MTTYDPQGAMRGYPARGDWVERARCVTYDPALFYPTAGGSLRPNSTHLMALQALCAACPVAAECLDYALACEDLDPYGGHGVWAGLTGRERNQLRLQLKESP